MREGGKEVVVVLCGREVFSTKEALPNASQRGGLESLIYNGSIYTFFTLKKKRIGI